MSKIPIIAVVGPTASGKSNLAVALAKHYDAEILSFDSMQLYKGMDIATAKPTADEMQGIPHHMISAVDNEEAFSVARYKESADRIIDEITARGKRVVMVGGTGLYLDTVMQNIELLQGEDTTEIREQLKAELAELGPAAMLGKLREIDPKTAETLHENNTGRVLRALEVYYSTGHTMSYQVENSKNTPSRYRPVYIGLNAKDRDFLYNRINSRVDVMLQTGLLTEVEQFVNSAPGTTAKQAIGLKELAPYARDEESLDTAVERLKMETRRYAKRQLTWFRRNENVNWLYIDELQTAEALLGAAIDIVDNSKIFSEE